MYPHFATASSSSSLVFATNLYVVENEFYRDPYTIARDPNPKPKHRCIYCHGITYDDSRGNCIACGAPRGREVIYTFAPEYEDDVGSPAWLARHGATVAFGEE